MLKKLRAISYIIVDSYRCSLSIRCQLLRKRHNYAMLTIPTFVSSAATWVWFESFSDFSHFWLSLTCLSSPPTITQRSFTSSRATGTGEDYHQQTHITTVLPWKCSRMYSCMYAKTTSHKHRKKIQRNSGTFSEYEIHLTCDELAFSFSRFSLIT